jgi:hypothetical protein
LFISIKDLIERNAVSIRLGNSLKGNFGEPGFISLHELQYMTEKMFAKRKHVGAKVMNELKMLMEKEGIEFLTPGRKPAPFRSKYDADRSVDDAWELNRWK